MEVNPERWQIPWVRWQRQYIVEPPVDFIFDGVEDDWMEVSFDTIREAMDWIDKRLQRQPAVDSPVPAVEAVNPLYVRNVDVAVIPPRNTTPILPPAGLRQQQVSEPVLREEPRRVMNDSERMRGNRTGVVNPISGQSDSPSRRDRLDEYSQMVGLQ